MERRTIYGIFLLLFLIAGLSVYGFLHQLYDSGKLITPADVQVTAAGMTVAYERDEGGADSLYLYKVVSVTGVLRELVESGSGDYVARLTGDGTGSPSVDCHLDSLNKPEDLSLRAGDSITIRGTCTGRWLNIMLVQCIVEK